MKSIYFIRLVDFFLRFCTPFLYLLLSIQKACVIWFMILESRKGTSTSVFDDETTKLVDANKCLPKFNFKQITTTNTHIHTNEERENDYSRVKKTTGNVSNSNISRAVRRRCPACGPFHIIFMHIDYVCVCVCIRDRFQVSFSFLFLRQSVLWRFYFCALIMFFLPLFANQNKMTRETKNMQ